MLASLNVVGCGDGGRCRRWEFVVESEACQRQLDLSSQGPEERFGKAGLEGGEALQSSITGTAGVVELIALAELADRWHERLSWRLAQACSVLAVCGFEKQQEVTRLLGRQTRPGDGERRCQLLLGREPGDALQESHPQELLGEGLAHLGVKPPEELHSPLDPEPFPPDCLGDGAGGEAVGSVEPHQLELLGERGPAAGVVAPEALEAGLDPVPGLDDDPDVFVTAFLEGEEALEAIDEEEAPLGFLDHQQRIVEVDRCRWPMGRGELERDRPQRDLAQAHRSLLRGRERTWKVG
jgi:hypothetical protein